MRTDLGVGLAACAVILSLLASGTAHADAVSPAEAIAEELETSPVYVDPAYTDAFPEEARARAERAIVDSELPVRVVLVPLVDGDVWNGEAGNLAAAVHDRTGGDGHYIVLEDGSLYGSDFQESGDPASAGRAHYGSLAASYATDFDASLTEQVELAVDFAVTDDPRAAYEEQEQAYSQDQEEAPPPAPEQDREQEQEVTVWPWVVGGVVLLLVLAGVYLLWTRPRSVVSLPQHAAFDNADRAHRQNLEERSTRELLQVGERLSVLEPADSDAAGESLRGALDAYAAARTVHERRDGGSLADVVGVLVLLDLVEEHMAGARRRTGRVTPKRHCYANPLHGRDARMTDWRELGAVRTVRVPLCPKCAKAVRARRRPTALVVEHRGERVPYYEVPAEESVWAATGFGALTDDLVRRIQRGDHSRSRG